MDEGNYEEFEMSSSIAVLMNCSPIKTWKKERHFVFPDQILPVLVNRTVNHRHTSSSNFNSLTITLIATARDVERKKLKYVAFF